MILKQASGGQRKSWPDMNGTKPMKGIRPIPTVTPIKIESVFRKPPGMSETASRHGSNVNTKVGVAETPIMGMYREDNAAKDLHAAETKAQEAQDAASRTGDALKSFKELMSKNKDKDKGPSSEMLAMDKSRTDMEQAHLKAELAMTKREMQLQKREMALAVPKPVENKDSGGHEYACKSLSSRLSKLASVLPQVAMPAFAAPTKGTSADWATPHGAQDLYTKEPTKPQPFLMKGVPKPSVVEPIRPGHLATQSFFPGTATKNIPTDGFSNMLMQLRGPAGFGPGVHPDYAKYYSHETSQDADQGRLLSMLAAIQRMPSLSQMK